MLVCRQLALDIEESLIPGGGYDRSRHLSENGEEDEDDLFDLSEDDLIETKSVIVKADGAGSLTSIQDTVDEMVGISVR